jgi:hypothetical protein
MSPAGNKTQGAHHLTTGQKPVRKELAGADGRRGLALHHHLSHFDHPRLRPRPPHRPQSVEQRGGGKTKTKQCSDESNAPEERRVWKEAACLPPTPIIQTSPSPRKAAMKEKKKKKTPPPRNGFSPTCESTARQAEKAIILQVDSPS